jgi:bifunctional oligoribonuclease and PAP phosphatase NrnA
MTQATHETEILSRIREVVRSGQRFLVTSHARPDGDSIGSQLALAYALRSLGKHVRVVNRDPAPPHYHAFPGVGDIEIRAAVEGDYDALFVMECSDLTRPGVAGLERYFIVNIDHHAGNAMYGRINWFDESAAACGEMVMDVIDALGVPLSREIATHIYLAILTDTGSFHHSHITPRTFETCRRTAEAGVDAAAMARSVFDSNSFGKLKLIGRLLDSMQLEEGGRLAVLQLDDEMLRAAGCTPNDTEGLINLPLTSREIQAVVFFRDEGGDVRVSLRSKGDVDVREVAQAFGGGGHKNASGFILAGAAGPARRQVIDLVVAAIETAAAQARRH